MDFGAVLQIDLTSSLVSPVVKSTLAKVKIKKKFQISTTIEPREIIARKQSKTSQVFRHKLRGHERRATDSCTDIRMLNTWPWNHSRIYWSIVYELLELGLSFGYLLSKQPHGS